MVHFKGTRYESRRCPLSVVKSQPGLFYVLTLYHHTDGKLGAAALTSGAPLVEAFGAIDEGRAYTPRSGSK